MPFTDKPSNLAPIPSATERAVSAVLADAGSFDQKQHTAAAIKFACPECAANVNARCLERDPKRFVPFHPARLALVPESL